ncbi:MAG TPA: SDR family NAD(P)-dependent oxidoreductase [Acidimicrobiales bacterium]|nr:SDR family NAD(P)-dependent oxidoreductase [Acidimicrobiales bacterium]
MRLKGKVALVVGGGQADGEALGNGRAVSLLFGREGAHVVVADRDMASAEVTAKLVADVGGTSSAVHLDVTDEDSVRAAVEHCRTLGPRLDVLHNNVGISAEGGDVASVTDLDAAVFDHIVAVNLRGMALVCKHAVPLMRAQRSGAIVNIASIAVRLPYSLVTYKITKAGVVALTEHLAMVNAPYGIRANAILPGLIDTPMGVDRKVVASGRSRAEIVAERDARVPLGHMGTAWDVAHAALFLASDEAGFVTGAALPVDGGMGLDVGGSGHRPPPPVGDATPGG